MTSDIRQRLDRNNTHSYAGKCRLVFGRLNPLQPHAYSPIYIPLPREVFFGEDGVNDIATRPSSVLPTGRFHTEATGAVLKGDILTGERAPLSAASSFYSSGYLTCGSKSSIR